MDILKWGEVLPLIKDGEVKCCMSYSEIESWIVKHNYLDKVIHTEDDLDDNGLAETYDL